MVTPLTPLSGLKLQTQEDQILTVPPAEVATDKDREPLANPELYPACFKTLDFPSQLSTEKEEAADTCHRHRNEL